MLLSLCPQAIVASEAAERPTVRIRHDTADHICPMSGKDIPIGRRAPLGRGAAPTDRTRQTVLPKTARCPEGQAAIERRSQKREAVKVARLVVSVAAMLLDVIVTFHWLSMHDGPDLIPAQPNTSIITEA